MTPNTKPAQATCLRRCVLLVSVLAAGCAVGQGGTWVKASGQIQEQTRALEGFTGLEVGPGFTAEVMAGEAFAVVVRGDAAFLPHVETRVEHGSLVVRLSDRVAVRPRALLSVAVRMPSVDRLGVIGSQISLTGLSGSSMALRAMAGSKLRAHGVRGHRLALTVGERSRVEIDGQVNELRAQVTGASEVHARQLHARSATVAVTPGARLEMQNVGKDGRELASLLR